MTALICGESKLRSNKSNGCLLLLKVDNIQKSCLSLKSGFFPLAYWFVNLTLTDKQTWYEKQDVFSQRYNN